MSPKKSTYKKFNLNFEEREIDLYRGYSDSSATSSNVSLNLTDKICLDKLRQLAFVNIRRVINWREYKNENREILNKCKRKEAQMLRETNRHNYRFDLHGYNPVDALYLVDVVMEYFINLTCFPNRITFIVGRGTHSDNGPVISSVVIDFLNDYAKIYKRLEFEYGIGTVTVIRKKKNNKNSK
jgi:hypothetical protein